MNWKHYLGMAVVTIVTMAIVNRVAALQQIVYNTTPTTTT